MTTFYACTILFVCIVCARNARGNAYNHLKKRKDTEMLYSVSEKGCEMWRCEGDAKSRGYFQHKIHIPKAQWHTTTIHAFVQIWIEINCHTWQNVLAKVSKKKHRHARQQIVVVFFPFHQKYFGWFFCVCTIIIFVQFISSFDRTHST